MSWFLQMIIFQHIGNIFDSCKSNMICADTRSYTVSSLQMLHSHKNWAMNVSLPVYNWTTLWMSWEESHGTQQNPGYTLQGPAQNGVLPSLLYNDPANHIGRTRHLQLNKCCSYKKYSIKFRSVSGKRPMW